MARNNTDHYSLRKIAKYIASLRHTESRLLPCSPSTPRMSEPPPSFSASSPISFSSPSSLSSFLTSHLPPNSLSSWGSITGTKTLHNLWIEITNGESSLSLPLTRTVNVATLHLKNRRGQTLIESKQLLSDGTLRDRNRPLSEKMMPGEDIEIAVARGIREELGEQVRATVYKDTCRFVVDEEKTMSVSYPGLPSRYVMHSVDAVLEQGIPVEGEFETDEHGDENDDGNKANTVFVRKHFWKWTD